MIKAIGVTRGGDFPIYSIHRDIPANALFICRDDKPILGPFCYPEHWHLCSKIVTTLAGEEEGEV